MVYLKAKFNHLKKYYSDYNLFFLKKFKREIKSDYYFLDVGCGHLRNSFFFHELGFKNITAIDWQIPKPIFDFRNTQIKFIQHDIKNEFPFEENYFDVVFCNYVLMFIDENDLIGTLKNLSKVVRKFLIIEVYDLEKNLKRQNETDFTEYNFNKIISYYENNSEFIIRHKKYDGKLILEKKELY